MKKTVKQSLALLLSLLLLAGLFGGCASRKNNPTLPPVPAGDSGPAADVSDVDTSNPAEIIRAAVERTNSCESIHMYVDYPASLGLRYGTETQSMDVHMQMDMDLVTDPWAMHGSVMVDMLGQNVTVEMYATQEGDQMVTYTRESEGSTFTRSEEQSDLTHQQLLNLPVDEIGDWTMEETDEAYLIHTEITMEVVQSMVSALGESALGGLNIDGMMNGNGRIAATFTVDKQTLLLEGCEMDVSQMVAENITAAGYGVEVTDCDAVLYITYSDYDAVEPFAMPTDWEY